MRVHNRFGGMRLWRYSGQELKNRSGKREFQLRVGAGFCVIKGSGCENRKGKVAGYANLIFTRLHDLTSSG